VSRVSFWIDIGSAQHWPPIGVAIEDDAPELPAQNVARACPRSAAFLEHNLLFELELGLIEDRVHTNVDEHLDGREDSLRR